MKLIGTLTVAMACAFGLAVNAQDTTTTKTKTKVKVDDAKMVTYTGCVQTGTETTTYILGNAMPVVRAQRIGTSGTVLTTYVLIPGADTVTFTNMVGHKVEVHGMLIPAGQDAKVKTRTKIEREGAPDVKIKEKEKTDSADMPRFKVMSVKHLADTCTP